MFAGPAHKYTLTRRRLGEDCEALFPMRSLGGDFGVINIWVGEEKRPFIEYERIPLGSTVTFSGKNNLEIRALHGNEILGRIRARLNPGIIYYRYKTISLVSLVDIKSKQALINHL